MYTYGRRGLRRSYRRAGPIRSRYTRRRLSSYSYKRSRLNRNVTRINTTKPPPDSRMIEAYKDRSFKPFMDPNFQPADCTYAKLRFSYPLKQFSTLATNATNSVLFQGNLLEAFDNPSQATNVRLPVGYTKYYGDYNKYEVYGCAIEVSFFNIDATNNLVVYVTPLKKNIVTQSNHGALDQPYTKWKVIGPGTGPSVCKIKSYMTTSKLYGFPSNTDLAGAVSLPGTLGNSPTIGPANPWAWCCGCIPMYTNPPTAGALPNVSVKLTWYVKYFDRSNVEN